MGIIAAIIVVLLPISVGALPAFFLTARRSTLDWAGNAFAIGAIILSLIACLPPVVPFDAWLYATEVVGLVSVVIAGALAVRKRIGFRFPSKAVQITACAAILLIAVHLLIVTDIGWDAVNYYFLTAVDYAVSNHVALYYSNAVTLTHHAPVPLFPLVIILYAAGIDIATLFHATASSAVHLVPLGFFLGTLSALKRIGVRLLGRRLLFLVPVALLCVPIMIDYWNEYSYYVDLPTVMFACLALAESIDIVRFDKRPATWIRLGLWITGILMTKVTGLVVAGIVLFPLFVGLLPSRKARALLAVAILGVFLGGGFKLGQMSLQSEPWRWVGFVLGAVCLLALVISVTTTWRKSLLQRALLFAIALIPGAAYLVRHTLAFGSPVGYYAASLLSQPPDLRWAFHLLQKNNPDKWLSQPGNPDNFPLVPFFGWSFAPPLSWLAAAGAWMSSRVSRPVAIVTIFVVLYYLAFDTVFGLTNIRELLVVAPIVALLALVGLRRLVTRRLVPVAYALLLIASFPFAWLAQQGESPAFDNVVAGFGLQGWTASSDSAMFLGLDYGLLCVLIVLALWSASKRLKPDWRGFRAAPLLAFVPVLVLFAPFLANAGDAHVRRNAQEIQQYHQGYFAALSPTIAMPGKFVVLTYFGYGYEWFSVGRIRRLELSAATDLATLAPYLRSDPKTLRAYFREADVRVAVVPDPGSAFYPQFKNLLNSPQMKNLRIVLSHAASHAVGLWRVYDLTESGHSPVASNASILRLASALASETTAATRSKRSCWAARTLS